ncbi:hypothetical protein ACLOJK_016932 [Asimina triloba]
MKLPPAPATCSVSYHSPSLPLPRGTNSHNMAKGFTDVKKQRKHLFIPASSLMSSMAWSPDLAMKAYLHTLKLCKEYCSHDECEMGSLQRIEPKSMEYISALAAGNEAQLMVEISSKGISPLTVALAVAAKYTCGRLICILDKQEALQDTKHQMAIRELEDAIDFVVGDPCEVIRRYKNINFVIIDSRVDDCLKLLKTIDVNPSGSVVVVNNLFHTKTRPSYAQVVRGKFGIESVTLPIGEGMEVTKVGWRCKHEGRASKRSNVKVET